MRNRLVVIIIIFIFSMIGFISIGYSAFSTSLSISGDAFVRTNGNLRITNLELIDKQNGGLEQYNSSYSNSLTSMFVYLPNTNSSVTYRVTVTNKTSSYFTPGEIKSLVYSNTNVNYVLDGIESYGVYQGSNYTFNITFTTSSANQSCNLTLRYDFKTVSENTWNFDYTGSPNTFSVLYSAEYKIELWGAQGGNTTGGKGAYVRGTITIKKGTDMYVYVGEHPTYLSGNCYGSNPNNAFNGNLIGSCAGAGGASDVRLLKTTNWYDVESLRSRIIVSGAGGGAYYEGSGGYGGGLNGGSYTGGVASSSGGAGATQSLYVFGYSDSATTLGGGGFYSGQSGYARNSGGGSSYISGYKGCIAVSSSSDTTPKCSDSVASNDVSCSYHYSGYKFSDMLMIAGNASMTSPTGASEVGHSGNGYARITLIPRS